MAIRASEVADFMKRYETAANTRAFAEVAPMIAEDALFRFNDGDFRGRESIHAAFEKTWGLGVRDERFALEGVTVVSTDRCSAVVSYDFVWSGVGKDGPFQVRGRGTNVLVERDGVLQVLYEHLSS